MTSDQEIFRSEVSVASVASKVNHQGLKFPSQYRLSPRVEAALAKAGDVLISNWRPTSGLVDEFLLCINENAIGEADKLVLLSFKQGVLQISQFVFAFQIFLLQLKQRGVDLEQGVLGFEKFGVDVGERGRDFIEVADACRCLSKFFRGRDGSSDCPDQ